MSFKATDQIIYDLIQDKLFIIPDNQRKYIWDENNWQELFDDLLLVFDGKLEKHFIGSIVLIDTHIDDGIKNHFVVVDGQQRILSLTILFAAISALFAGYKMFDSFSGMERFLIVKDSKASKHTIVSKEANQDIKRIVSFLFLDKYDEIVDGAIDLDLNYLVNNLKIKKNIKDCFSFFYNKIKNLTINNHQLLEVFSNAVQEIKFVQIVAKEEDAYTVFEILNARGKPLTDFELLRNFVLKYSKAEDKEYIKEKIAKIETILGDYTNAFLKHYAVHKYKTDSNTAKKPYKTISNNEKGSNIKLFVDDLFLKCIYYNKITTFCGCTDLERKIFSFFKPRRQQQFRPLLLGLMHQLDLDALSKEEYNASINYLYLFFICYNVIGEQTSNKIEDIVYNYSFKIENEFKNDLISDMKTSMWSRIPSESDFINSITHIKYSHCRTAYSGSRKAETVKAVLEVLELEKGYVGAFDGLTIEHCLPDSVSEDNDTIGNLILLEHDLNGFCDNKTLSEKVTYYKMSKMKMANEISDEANSPTFRFDVASRTKNIANQLYTCLKGLI